MENGCDYLDSYLSNDHNNIATVWKAINGSESLAFKNTVSYTCSCSAYGVCSYSFSAEITGKLAEEIIII